MANNEYLKPSTKHGRAAAEKSGCWLWWLLELLFESITIIIEIITNFYEGIIITWKESFHI